MTNEVHKPFNFRAFWSLLAALSLAGLPWTGLENHLHQFEPLTGARHGWMAAHDSLALIFMVAAGAHVVLNGRALVRYARNLASRAPALSREALVALVLIAGLVFLAVGHTQRTPGPGRGRRAVVEGGADSAVR
jgi:hypothetical protein